MATSPALYRKLPYKTLDDFEYLGLINEVPMTIISKKTLPATNFAELRKWLEDNRGKINIANTGVASASHRCGLMSPKPAPWILWRLRRQPAIDPNVVPRSFSTAWSGLCSQGLRYPAT
jgi:hypothetical protein